MTGGEALPGLGKGRVAGLGNNQVKVLLGTGTWLDFCFCCAFLAHVSFLIACICTPPAGPAGAAVPAAGLAGEAEAGVRSREAAAAAALEVTSRETDGSRASVAVTASRIGWWRE